MPDEQHPNTSLQAQNRLLEQRIRLLIRDRDDLLLALERLLNHHPANALGARTTAERVCAKVRERKSH